MAIQGYDTAGPYTHGLWLIAKPDGSQAGIVDAGHLPSDGQGVKFYWLGTDRGTQMASLIDAFGKWGLKFDPNMNFANVVDAATKTGTVAVSQPTGLSAWLSGLKYAASHVAITAPVSLETAALEGGAAAEGSGLAGGAAGAAGTAAATAKAALTALTVGSLFSNPSLWAGVGMALLGAILVLFGIIKLSGADPKQLAKKVIR